LNETKEQKVQQRSLSLSQAILYGVGCGIGGSIFVLLGTGIDIADSGVLFSLLFGGVLIFFTALNYAELSTSLPLAGGAYNFSKEGLGGFLAFIIGFFLWIGNISACSFSALTFAAVFGEIFNLFGLNIHPFITVSIAIIAILFTSLVFFRTQKIAIRVLILFTVVLIILFGVFVFSGLIIAPITATVDYTVLLRPIQLIPVITALPLLFILFTPIISNLSYLNSEVKNPSKNIPRINILAITISLIIYLSITFVVLVNIGNPPPLIGETPVLLAVVLGNILGPFGFYLMAAAAFISTMIAINAGLGSGVSVITALARDRYIPETIQKIKKTTQMPVLALSLTTLISVVFTYFASIGLAAETTTFIYFFGLAFINYAAVKLRRTRKELDRPFKAPFFPILPFILSGSFVVLAIFFFSPQAVLLGLIIVSIGVGYFLISISDRASKSLTLAGIKTFLALIMGFFIWMINNLTDINIEFVIINRILTVITVVTLATAIFDIIPLREFVYFFVKKIDKEKVVISIGTGQIIELGKKRAKFIHYMNYFLSLIQIVSAVILIWIGYLNINSELNIGEVIINSTVILPNTINYIYSSIMIILGIVLILSGTLLWITNRELKSIGI
jgi:amino acid transporter